MDRSPTSAADMLLELHRSSLAAAATATTETPHSNNETVAATTAVAGAAAAAAVGGGAPGSAVEEGSRLDGRNQQQQQQPSSLPGSGQVREAQQPGVVRHEVRTSYMCGESTLTESSAAKNGPTTAAATAMVVRLL